VEDPEKEALAFAQQNQTRAESELKHLQGEAARLRARLQKVEAAIKRWDGLLDALKRSQANHRVEEAASPPAEKSRDPGVPLDLAPTPAATGHARNP
jgi:hypothetical protein